MMEEDKRSCIDVLMREYGCSEDDAAALLDEVCREVSAQDRALSLAQRISEERRGCLCEAEMKAALIVAAKNYIRETQAIYDMYAERIHIYESLIEFTGGIS